MFNSHQANFNNCTVAMMAYDGNRIYISLNRRPFTDVLLHRVDGPCLAKERRRYWKLNHLNSAANVTMREELFT